MTVCRECGEEIEVGSSDIWVHSDTGRERCLANTVARPTAESTYHDSVPYTTHRDGFIIWVVEMPSNVVWPLSHAINHKDFMGYVWGNEPEPYHTIMRDGEITRCDAVRFRGEG